MIKAYLATSFFSEPGFEWTAKVAEQIRKNTEIDLYVPQENGEINDKENNDSIGAIDIADGDNAYLEKSNILIASLDGVEIDSGVSAEIGYFSGLINSELKLMAKPKTRIIVGVYTDIRRNGTGDNRFYINLYTKGLVEKYGFVVNSTDELIEKLIFLEKTIKEEVNNYGGIL